MEGLVGAPQLGWLDHAHRLGAGMSPTPGFKGDYQSTQVLTPTANGFPWLAQVSGTSCLNRPAGGTYTLVGTDIPLFLLHLDHLSRRVKFEAFGDRDNPAHWEAWTSPVITIARP